MIFSFYNCYSNRDYN